MKRSFSVRNIAVCGVCIALCYILPLALHPFELGTALSPMHIPVLLCGFLCGWHYGALVGLILPFLRSAIFGMPPMYPQAIWMAAELATYGLVAGIVYSAFKTKSLKNIYISLITAQISGRIVWGIVKTLLLLNTQNPDVLCWQCLRTAVRHS